MLHHHCCSLYNGLFHNLILFSSSSSLILFPFNSRENVTLHSSLGSSPPSDKPLILLRNPSGVRIWEPPRVGNDTNVGWEWLTRLDTCYALGRPSTTTMARCIRFYKEKTFFGVFFSKKLIFRHFRHVCSCLVRKKIHFQGHSHFSQLACLLVAHFEGYTPPESSYSIHKNTFNFWEFVKFLQIYHQIQAITVMSLTALGIILHSMAFGCG